MIKCFALFAVIFILFIVPTPFYKKQTAPLYDPGSGNWEVGCPLALRIMYGGTGHPPLRYRFCLQAFANKVTHTYERTYEVGKSYGPVESMAAAVKIVKNTKEVYELMQNSEAGVEPNMYEQDSKKWRVDVYKIADWGKTYTAIYYINSETGEITMDSIKPPSRFF